MVKWYDTQDLSPRSPKRSFEFCSDLECRIVFPTGFTHMDDDATDVHASQTVIYWLYSRFQVKMLQKDLDETQANQVHNNPTTQLFTLSNCADIFYYFNRYIPDFLRSNTGTEVSERAMRSKLHDDALWTSPLA